MLQKCYKVDRFCQKNTLGRKIMYELVQGLFFIDKLQDFYDIKAAVLNGIAQGLVGGSPFYGSFFGS